MGRRTQTLIDELPLFSAAKAKVAAASGSPVEAELKALTVDELSPRQALDALYRLKTLIVKDG
jgi:DNA mismatch repair protein MutS